MSKTNRLIILAFWMATRLPVHSQDRSMVPANSVAGIPPPGAEFHIEATPRTGTIGDPIKISLDISVPEGYQVAVPRLDSPLGDFAILDFKPGSTQSEPISNQKSPPSETKRLHRHIEILTAVYKTGKFAFPSMEFKIKSGNGKEFALASDPVSIEIRSILDSKNANLKDLKKQAEIPEPIRWALWIGLALVIIVLLVLFLFLHKRKRETQPAAVSAPAQDALVVAEAELRKLIAGGLPIMGMEKQFYIQISDITKRILETSYEVSAIEQTTDEIMNALRNKPLSSPDDTRLIASFLISCDLVKFAKYIPSRSEQELAVKQAMDILNCAKKQRAVSSGQPAIAGGEMPIIGSSYK